MELAAGEHGAIPHQAKILGQLHGPATCDPAEASAARTQQPHATGSTCRANRGHPAPPASSCGRRLSPPVPPATRTTARSASGRQYQTRTPARARRQPGRLPGRTRQSGQPAAGPTCKVRNEPTRGPRTRSDPNRRRSTGPLHAHMGPGTIRPRQPGTVPKKAVTDSIHRWRSPANHGPQLPGRRTTRCKDSPTGQPPGPPSRAAPT